MTKQGVQRDGSVANNTWSLLTNSPQNWNDHVHTGFHKPIRIMVQQINEAKSNSDLIQLSNSPYCK